MKMWGLVRPTDQETTRIEKIVYYSSPEVEECDAMVVRTHGETAVGQKAEEGGGAGGWRLHSGFSGEEWAR